MRSTFDESDEVAVTHNVGDIVVLPVHRWWLTELLARCCGCNLDRCALYRVTHVSDHLVSMEEVE